jgi:hypothetical protein
MARSVAQTQIQRLRVANAAIYDFEVVEHNERGALVVRRWIVRMRAQNPAKAAGLVIARFRRLHPDVHSTVIVTSWAVA